MVGGKEIAVRVARLRTVQGLGGGQCSGKHRPSCQKRRNIVRSLHKGVRRIEDPWILIEHLQHLGPKGFGGDFAPVPVQVGPPLFPANLGQPGRPGAAAL